MTALFSHWSASWPVLACYLVVAAAHLAGTVRLADRGLATWREAALCQAGLLITVLALVSPVGYWSGVYIWVRAVQELLVAFVGPGLIVVGGPWNAFRRARGRGGDAVAPGALAHPLAAVIAFNVIWIGWQLPAAFDTARADSGLALLEHATYVAGGLLLWLQLIGSRPLVPAAPPLRRAALLIGTVGVGTILGMVLVFGSGVVYPAYGGSAHQVMTVLDDQQLAGAVLWMGMLPPMILAGVTILMRWLSDEESADLSAGLDRMLSPRKSSWPTRSGVR
jgi:putative copper resistance protein D